MKTMTSAEAQNSFGRLLDIAQREAVAITRHGDTVGHYIPVPRRKRTDADRAAFKEASDRVSAMMLAAGVTEEQIIEDFERMKREERKRRSKAE